MAKSKNTKRVLWQNGSSVWAEVTPHGEGTRIQLLHRYPDLHPQKGWQVQVDGETLVVSEMGALAGQPGWYVCTTVKESSQ